MTRDFNSPAEQERIAELQKLVASELPELIAKADRFEEAAREPTVSGELRRTIHSSRIPLTRLARDAHLSPLDIDSFLAGDAPLPSDALDRLAATLGCSLPRPQPVSEDGPEMAARFGAGR